VARMVMMGIEFAGDVPFDDVYIHSVIQAPDGRRMSKSLGTGIDPLDEIESHGADAVRFGLLAMSSSQDVRYSAEKIAQGQRLANKLWNASRLVLLEVPADTRPAPRPTRPEDHWILSRLAAAVEATDRRIEEFDFAHAALGLYEFVYGELCDWYLELVKPRLYEGDRDAAATLLHVLRETVAMAHPAIPFVTEEIWSYLPGSAGLLAAAGYPSPGERDPAAEQAVGRTIAAVEALRGWRDRVNAPAGAVIPARLAAEGYGPTAEQLARLSRFDLSDGAGGDPVASVAVPGGAVEVLPTEAIDFAAAERRRAKQVEALRGDIERTERKLANEGFVAKAPRAVVEKERRKLDELRRTLEEV